MDYILSLVMLWKEALLLAGGYDWYFLVCPLDGRQSSGVFMGGYLWIFNEPRRLNQHCFNWLDTKLKLGGSCQHLAGALLSLECLTVSVAGE